MLTTVREDAASRGGVILAIILITIVAAMHIITPIYITGGGTPVQWIYNLMLIVGSGGLTVMAALLWRSFQRSKAKRRVWALMTIGFAAWAMGDILYAYNQLIAQSDLLYPSFPDVSFALAYIPLGLALIFRVTTLRASPSPPKVIAIVLVVLVFGAGVVAYGVAPALQEAESSAFAQFITLLYPVGDLLLVLGAALVFLTLEGGRLALPWMLIPIGFLMFVIGDTAYGYGQLAEVYVAGEGVAINFITFIAEVAYFAAYAIIGAGFYLQGRLQRVF